MVKPAAPVLPSEASMRSALRRAGARYEREKRAAEQAAVDWKWATGPYFHLTPLRAERWGSSPGRLLKAKPASSAGKFEFGFDQDGRLRVIRGWSRQAVRASETFFDYGEQRATSVAFGPTEKTTAASVGTYLLSGGRPIASIIVGEEVVRERYEYANGEVSRILIERKGRKDEYDVLRDPKTKVATLRSRALPAAPAPSQLSLPQLIWKIQSYMVKAIPTAVAEHAPRSPALCLALVYEGSTYECLPPQLALGSVQEFERSRKRHPDAPAAWWRGATFDSFGGIPFGDAEFEGWCSAFTLHMNRAGSNDEARDLLIETAIDLNKADWGALDVAPEFVVYACDMEPGSTLKMLKASVPTARWKQLERAGWVGSSDRATKHRSARR